MSLSAAALPQVWDGSGTALKGPVTNRRRAAQAYPVIERRSTSLSPPQIPCGSRMRRA